MQLALQILHNAFLDCFQPRLNACDPAPHGALEILLEPMPRARNGLFDRSDPGVDGGLQIPDQSHLERLEALLDRRQVLLEMDCWMLQKGPQCREQASHCPVPRTSIPAHEPRHQSFVGHHRTCRYTTYLGKFSEIISNTSPA